MANIYLPSCIESFPTSFSSFQESPYFPTIFKGKKAFQCGVLACKKVFRFKSDMERHVVVHTDSKPFTCPDPTCGKTFKRAEALKNHQQSHSKNYNYVCPLPGCNKLFRKKSILQYHLSKHHPSENFPCRSPGCQQAFPNVKLLRKHQIATGCGSEKELLSEREEDKIASASTSDDFEAPNLVFDNTFWSSKDASPQPEPTFDLDLEPRKLLHTEKEVGCFPFIENPQKNILSEMQLSSFVKEQNRNSSVNVEALLLSMLKHLKQENQELKEKLADILAQCEKEDSLLS